MYRRAVPRRARSVAAAWTRALEETGDCAVARSGVGGWVAVGCCAPRPRPRLRSWVADSRARPWARSLVWVTRPRGKAPFTSLIARFCLFLFACELVAALAENQRFPALLGSSRKINPNKISRLRTKKQSFPWLIADEPKTQASFPCTCTLLGRPRSEGGGACYSGFMRLLC